MDFALTDEQEAIREMARRFAEDELAPHAAAFKAALDHASERVHQILEGANEIMSVIVARDMLKEYQA